MAYVTLVGAGCGPDLITVRGLKAVQDADVILYDDLIPKELLREAKTGAELVYVGKRAGHHYKKQEETTELLIQYCKNHDDHVGGVRERNIHIVRLKGGDGFVFGRGGEEMIALREAGIPCEIIPGVSSSIAVPEEFGIPVTHRGIARSFTVITGHTAVRSAEREVGGIEGGAEKNSAGEACPAEDYRTLASLHGTLIFLMGLARVPEIASELIKNGKPDDTPAAILSRGFAPDAEKITGTLGTIGALSKEAQTPAILVIGETAGMELTGTVSRPLRGVRITVTGTESMTERLEKLFSETGATVIREQNILLVPQPENIPEDLTAARWLVFTSPNGVRIFFDSFYRKNGDIRKLAGLKFAVIGPGTARRLYEYGIHADFMPTEYISRVLGKELAEQIGTNELVYILRAAVGAPALTDEFDKAGIRYREYKIYRTEKYAESYNQSEEQNREKKEQSDYIVFASASGVRTWFDRKAALPNTTKPVCIGPSTAEELRRHTNVPCLIANPHTAEGVLTCILSDQEQN